MGCAAINTVQAVGCILCQWMQHHHIDKTAQKGFLVFISLSELSCVATCESNSAMQLPEGLTVKQGTRVT
jgi:hypothetical protein